MSSFRLALQTCGFAFPFSFPCPCRMTFRGVRSCPRCLTGLLWPQQGPLCPRCPPLPREGWSQQAAGEGCVRSILSLCRLRGYPGELLQHRNLPRSFRHLTNRFNDIKTFSFVWEGLWTSSLEGCHAFPAAGCLAIVFVQPEHRDSPPERNGEDQQGWGRAWNHQNSPQAPSLQLNREKTSLV